MKYILIILCTFFTLAVFSQDITFNWGQKFDEGDTLRNFIGEDANSLFVMVREIHTKMSACASGRISFNVGKVFYERFSKPAMTVEVHNIDDNGNVCVHGMNGFTDEEKKERKGEYWDQVLFIIPNNSETIFDYKVRPDPANHTRGFTAAFNEKEELFVAGTIESIDEEEFSGTFLMKYSMGKKEPVSNVVSKTEDTFLNQYIPDPKTRKKLLKDFTTYQVITSSDGGAYQFVYKMSIGIGTKGGPLFIYKYNADGKMMWNKMLPIDQAGSIDRKGFSGYFAEVINSKLYIIYIYNNSEENQAAAKMGESKPVKTYEKTRSYVSILSNSGEINTAAQGSIGELIILPAKFMKSVGNDRKYYVQTMMQECKCYKPGEMTVK